MTEYVFILQKAGDCLTSKELAKLAGVSQATVSRCLNNSPLVSEETKKLVRELAAKHSFQLNSSARGLKTKRTGVIGYIFSEDFTGFTNHYTQSDLYYRLRMKLMEKYIDVVPVFDDVDSHGVPNIEKFISTKRFDALVINRPNLSDELKAMLKNTKTPYLFIYDTNEEVTNEFMIYPSHKKMGYMVGKAFCERGYTRFVEVFGTKGRIDGLHKHFGFLSALHDYGIELPEDHMLYGNYRFDDALKTVSAHIDQFKNVQACFVQNDMMALGTIEALRRYGISVPEQVKIIGSDNIPMATWFKPFLTTMTLDYEKIISTTAEWVIDLINSSEPPPPRRLEIEAKIIYRDTF